MALTGFVRAATTDEVADGEMIGVSVDGEEIVLARVNGEFYAMDGICSHAFGMLADGTLEGHEVECPIHEGRFDVRTGTATEEPAEEPLTVYTVKIDGNEIFIGP